MSEQLYKAQSAVPMEAYMVSLINTAKKQGFAYLPDIADHLRTQRLLSMHDAVTYLEPLSRELDLMNVYNEYDELSNLVTTTYVFNDRDTALLFKLSL